MYVAFKYFNQSVGGLFSPEYVDAPWTYGQSHGISSPISGFPVIIIGTAGTAGLIRIMRANLLDELHKPYVVTARAKGMTETQLIWRYPVRVALNPFVSTIGWTLPALVSGATIVSIVLSLPTTGPLLLRALMSQDMYLAGSFILMLSRLTIIGTLISDILLAWLDPRIRLHNSKHVSHESLMARRSQPLQPARRASELEPQGPIQEDEAQIFVASQWQLIWWRFPQTQAGHVCGDHRASSSIWSPSLPSFWPLSKVRPMSSEYTFAPPQRLHLFERHRGGPVDSVPMSTATRWRSIRWPCGAPSSSIRRSVIPVAFFVRGAPYRMLGLIESDIHLIGPSQTRTAIPCISSGADRIGPRHVQPHHLRHAHLHDHRSGRRGPEFRSWASLLGGISGFYGGIDRQPHPAHDRVSALDSDHSALAGPGRGLALRPGRRSRSTSASPSCSRSSAGPDWHAWCAGVSSPCATEDFVMAARLDGSEPAAHHLCRTWCPPLPATSSPRSPWRFRP